MRRILSLISSILLAQSAIAADAPLKDYGQKDYVRVSRDLPHVEDKPWRLVCTMPYNCHFQPWIEAEAEAG